MPLPIDMKLSAFRHLSTQRLQEMIEKQSTLHIGAYTRGHKSRLVYSFCVSKPVLRPETVPLTTTVVVHKDFSACYNSRESIQKLLSQGAVTLTLPDGRFPLRRPPVLTVWPYESPVEIGTYSHTTKPRPSATIVKLDRPVIERPSIVKAPFVPVAPPAPPLPADLRIMRSVIERGATPHTATVGQSFSITGMLSVDLDPSEHTETHYTLIESGEVEGIINDALKRAYGPRIKTLRVRITGT